MLFDSLVHTVAKGEKYFYGPIIVIMESPHKYHIIITEANIKISTLWSRRRLRFYITCVYTTLYGEDIQSMTKMEWLERGIDFNRHKIMLLMYY